MNHHGKHINHVSILQRSKDEDSTDTTCCLTDGDPWSVKQVVPSYKNITKHAMHHVGIESIPVLRDGVGGIRDLHLHLWQDGVGSI